MSLHTLANHLQTAGRGEDKVLVHMTPGEVNGLQSLAMAHGGSLTINPHTGLPEAGFLSSILPMVAGAALAATGVGAPMAALMVGGAGAAMTGSLSKGLMMGLGAYGGAGLGTGLMGSAGAATAGALGSTGAAVSPAVGAGQALTATGLAGSPAAAAAMPAAAMPGINAITPGMMAAPTPQAFPGVQGGPTFGMPTAPPVQVVANAPTAPTAAGAPSVQSATSSAFDRFKSIPGKAYDLVTGTGPEADKAREEFLKQNKNYLLTGGLSALAMSRDTPKPPSQPRYKVNEYDWNREFNPSSREPGSSAERMYYADGGLTSLPVQQMSQQNAFMDNPRYPMASQNTPQYSVNRQNPISENVVYPATDTNTNPYNGQERFMAAGGSTSSSFAKTGLKTPGNIYGHPTGAPMSALTAAAKNVGIDSTKYKTRLDLYNALKKFYDDKDAATISGGTSNTSTSNAATVSAGTGNTVKTNTATSNTAPVSAADAAEAKRQLNYKGPGFIDNPFRSGEVTGITEFDFGKMPVSTTAPVSAAQILKDKLLANFSAETARGESIGTKGISSLPIAAAVTPPKTTVAENLARTGSIGQAVVATSDSQQSVNVPTKSGSIKYDLQPNGTWAPEKKSQEYKKLGYGTVDAVTGWDNKTSKPYEPEDVQQVFEEVVGRKATKDELNTYVGNKGTVQALATAINKLPDISIARGTTNPFTEKELQDQAKYYWGRQMTAGELAAFKKSNFANFKKLRDALSKSNQYVDYLNKLNKEQFTKENTPTPIGANPNDVSSTFSDILQRKPTSAELQNYLSKKISVNDLKTELKGSNEYIGRLVSDPKNLTSAIAALASTQIQNLSSQVINNLSSNQISAISTNNIAALTTNQVQNLSSQVINQLTSNQLQAISTNGIGTLATDQVQAIATTGIGALTTSQVQAIDTTGIGTLASEQIQAIATTGIGTLASEQIQAIATTGIAALTSAQIQNLTTQPATNLFTSQVQPLTPLPAPVVTEIGRNDILPPPITMTRQQMEEYGRQYSSFKPSSPGLYTPQVAPNPLASIEGSLPYRDVNKTLGLTGLYEQMARATPSIQSGMNFTPNQAVAQASPFGNTNPGMVSLQSIAPPSAQSYGSLLTPEEQALLGYAQAQPIIPGSQTNIASLTPEQQVYLSSAQAQPRNMAEGGYANGGYHLGDYSDGGRLLKGPGDGVSDSIPASIGNKQPARLADGEFVIPARIVSEIGNGSTDAGARKLYAMMNRIQQARNKTVGRGKVAVKSGADRMLPA